VKFRIAFFGASNAAISYLHVGVRYKCCRILLRQTYKTVIGSSLLYHRM